MIARILPSYITDTWQKRQTKADTIQHSFEDVFPKVDYLNNLIRRAEVSAGLAVRKSNHAS